MAAAVVALAINTAQILAPVVPTTFGVNCETGAIAMPAGVPYPNCRWGGDETSLYNWQLDQTNQGRDWYFITEPMGSSNSLPFGSSADLFVSTCTSAGIEALLTVPSLGWVACPHPGPTNLTLCVRNKASSYSVPKYGPQTATECTGANNASWCDRDCGNGIWVNGTNVVNDPTDASLAVNGTFMGQWMSHIISQGAAMAGLTRVALDNEPTIAYAVHRDIAPNPMSYDDMWAMTVEYASAIKAAAPKLKVHCLVHWGYCAYFSSGVDNAGTNCTYGPDRTKHGGVPLTLWMLQQMATYKAQKGVQLCDVLDIHYYPQGSNINSDDESPSVAYNRLMAPLSLYNSTYTDPSWINSSIALFPLFRGWIHEAGLDDWNLELAVSEYAFGGDTSITSAIAHVEALAVMVQYGVTFATRWYRPAAASTVEQAYKVYLNYDGSGRGITGNMVNSSSDDITQASTYAFLDEPANALRVVLLNKHLAYDATTTLNVSITWPASVPAGSVAVPVYQMSKGTMAWGFMGYFTVPCGPGAPVFTIPVPGWSVSLLDIPFNCTAPMVSAQDVTHVYDVVMGGA